MGRMQSMVYPDGEKLIYTYDSGGLLAGAYGQSEGEIYQYIKGIEYDEFGQRTKVEYGNSTVTTYEYNPKTRYLTQLKTEAPDGTIYQEIEYTYDREGNILKRENDNFMTDDAEAKRSTQTYEYDSLHRLVGSTGSYSKESWFPFFRERLNTYENSFTYSDTGRILTKHQVNRAKYPDGETVELSPSTYTFDYEYGSHRPNAVTRAGTRSFDYDASGNMTEMTDSSNGFIRELHRDEENRLLKTLDRIETEGKNDGENGEEEGNTITTGTTTYNYDANGNRIIKNGKFGEVVYVNPNYSVRNGDVLSKHVFAGNSRIASKLEMRDAQGSVDETGIYYVHPDHLGSSSVITTKDGGFHESIEYLPYGETWVHNKASETGYTTPYKFTGKELDPETGLYYYGARYYDPVLSRWISTDPPIAKGEYFPSVQDRIAAQKNNEEYKPEESLPGMGGVYNPINLDAYQYAGQNPVKFVDPDGREVWLLTDSKAVLGAGHSAILVEQHGDDGIKWSLFEVGPTGEFDLNAQVTILKDGWISDVVREDYVSLEEMTDRLSRYDRITRFDTSPEQDTTITGHLVDAGVNFGMYDILGNNCVQYAAEGLFSGGLVADPKIVRPNKSHDYIENNNPQYILP